MFVSAACCIYYYLLPDGNVSDTAKRLLSVFFLACVIAPLFSVVDTVKSLMPFEGAIETQTPTADYGPAAAAGEAAVRGAAEGVIRAHTDEPFRMDVSVHITADGRIDIKRLTVVFEREFAGREKLTAALRETLGEAVETEVVGHVPEEPAGGAGAAAEG